mgnify:FL=1
MAVVALFHLFCVSFWSLDNDGGIISPLAPHRHPRALMVLRLQTVLPTPILLQGEPKSELSGTRYTFC